MTQPSLISLDGTRLATALTLPAAGQSPRQSTVLIHGISSDHTEGGLYDDIAAQLSHAGCAVLAIDLRGHGQSDGEQTDFTIGGAITDVLAALHHAETLAVGPPVLVGASFGAGVCLHVAQHLAKVRTLLLINPRTDYRPWVTESDLFHSEQVNPEVQARLGRGLYAVRNGFRLGRCMVNELATWTLAPHPLINDAPVVVWHGEDDTTIPIETAKAFFGAVPGALFTPVPGAQHGFVDSSTNNIDSPATARLRSQLVRELVAQVDVHI